MLDFKTDQWETKTLSNSIVEAGFDTPAVFTSSAAEDTVLIFPNKSNDGFHAVSVSNLMNNYAGSDSLSIGENYSVEREPARAYVHDIKIDSNGNPVISDHIDMNTGSGVRNDKWLTADQITLEVLNGHMWRDGFENTVYSVFDAFKVLVAAGRFV